MASQEQQRPSRRGSSESDETELEPLPSTRAQEGAAAQDDDVESLLDEIDDVLESNAEQFVRQYTQKGGQ